MAVLTSTGITFSDSTSQASAFIGGRGQVFTSSGTFTVPAGITAVKATVVGGGGNGATCTGNPAAGGGGGGGGVAIKFVTGLTPGGTVTVTVGGVAGTSSFGSNCSATGGATAATVTGNSTVGAGGAGGAGSSGDLNISGSAGSATYERQIGCGYYRFGGCGGGSSGGTASPPSTDNADSGGQPQFVNVANGNPGQGFIGGCGGMNALTNNSTGFAATGYGNGGGGAATNSGADQSGGAGSGGIVIVEF